jgi:adenine-specific DNA-methyltransferase
MLDTAFFTSAFKMRLLACFENLDEITDGLIIHGENFQALNILTFRYAGRLECIYIDPPYNTDSSPILYKNDYKDSSWLALMENRLQLASGLLQGAGILCAAIDDEEVAGLNLILSQIFTKQIGVVAVRSNPAGRKTKGRLAPAHEYALFYGKSDDAIPSSLAKSERSLARYPREDENGRFAWANFIRSGTNDRRVDRPKLFYPIYVASDNSIRIPSMTWSEEGQTYLVEEEPVENEVIVYPIVENGGRKIEKRWQRGHVRFRKEPEEFRVRRDENGAVSIDFKTRMDTNAVPITWWDDKKYASANYGAAELKGLFGEKIFDFAKSTKLVEDCLRTAGFAEDGAVVLDFFAGSGTTGHAVMNINRERDEGGKYILVEMGEYFDTVLKPRLQKAAFADQWRNGNPVLAEGGQKGMFATGQSHMFQYLRLESYDDTFHNIRFREIDGPQLKLLSDMSDYFLSYMLDHETEGSPTLLDLKQFDHPFDYKLLVSNQDGVLVPQPIDLVTTFNFLIGLIVHSVRAYEHDGNPYIRVLGKDPRGIRICVVWRNVPAAERFDAERQWLEQEVLQEIAFDKLYINGENSVTNTLLIEEEFKRRMFEGVR